MDNEKFIIDTDIGDDIDDAYAIAYLSQEIKERTLGITTVFKNSLQRAKLTAHFLKLLDWNIPVAAGESKPLKAEILYLPFEKPSDIPQISQYDESYKNETIHAKHGVDFILDAIKENEKITLLCIGPLTNIALAFQKDPQTFRKVHRILIMGGYFGGETSEWNVRCDPEAFEIVLNSGAEIEMVGYDLTKYALLSQRDVDYIKTLKSAPLKFLEKITSNYLRYYDYTRLPCMHDPLAVSLITHKFVKMKPMRVKVEMDEGNKGITVFNEEGAHVKAAYKARQLMFRKHLMRKLRKLDKTQYYPKKGEKI